MKFYTLSPLVPENPHLFPMMRQTFIEKEHSFVDRIEDCDIVLLDLHVRHTDYKQEDIDWVLNGRVKICSWDEFDKGGLSTLDWPDPLTGQQKLIFEHIEVNNIKSIHFCRLLNKKNTYQANVYPYEKSIMHEEPLLTPDQLFDRKYDVVFIANTAPQRERLKKVLEADGRLKCNIILGAKKIEYNDWLNEHRKGKMFVKWSAGGYGCEKAQNLFSISAMIKEDNDQLLLHDWTHLENCIKISPEPLKEEIDTLVEVVNNKEKLYSLYESNYHFMKKYYSKEYIANDIISKIEKHLL